MTELIVDEKADAAYLYISGPDDGRKVDHTEPILGPRNEMINLDFDAQGYLVGIELIPASALLKPDDR